MVEGWKKDKLTNIIAQITTGKLDANAMVPNGEYRFYTCAKDYCYIDSYAFDDEALLISGNGEYVGYIHYYKGKFNAYQRVYVLTGFKINVKYLENYLNRYLPIRINKEVSQNNIPYIRLSTLSKMDVLFPESLSEQASIANILSSVDEAIESVKKSIEAAEKLKKSLMQNLLTGRMKPDGTFRTEDEFYEDEKFGKVPKGWEVKKGYEITNKITKGQSPKWQGFEYQNHGILFVTSENIRNGYIDVSSPKYLPIEFNNKIKNSQLSKGDILINIVGTSIGRCAIYNLNNEFANTNQAVCVFRPNSDNDSQFLSLYLQNETTQKRLLKTQVETARANLSLGDFRKFKFIIPKKEEQIEISNKINQFNDIIVKNVNKLTTLMNLKKSLMQNLLTGKVRVK